MIKPKQTFLIIINIFIVILLYSCAKNKNNTYKNITEEFKKCYVSFNPTGHEGNQLFKVFAQSTTNPNYYWRFAIAHEKDLSDKTYSDQYRIIDCKEFTFNGVEMHATGKTLLNPGESEFTYKRTGAKEPTGGFHGKEKYTEVSFLINNNLINNTFSKFNLRGCESFTYVQKSIIYRDDNVNIEDALHQKTTTISNSGYFTKNTITAKIELPINTCFGSLASFSPDLTEKAFANNQENVIVFNQDGNKKLEDYCDNLVVWSDKNKLSANIESVFSVYNDYATQYIWDHKFYGKYYRYFQNMVLNEGESWSFETKVTFNKL